MAHLKGQQDLRMGREPSLVVMGGYSCLEGREFESRHRILNEYFSHIFAMMFV